MITASKKYPGGKEGHGKWQRLAALIPPHRVRLVPFAGFDALSRNMRPSTVVHFCDVDVAALDRLATEMAARPGGDFRFHLQCGIEFLRHWFELARRQPPPDAARDPKSPISSAAVAALFRDHGHHQPLDYAAGTGSRDSASQARVTGFGGGSLDLAARSPENTFVFVDAPYRRQERCNKRLYLQEWDDADHGRLLEVATRLPSPCMITCYPNEQYDAAFRDWWSTTYSVWTHGGERQERCWMNYPRPRWLHDPRSCGAGKRDRERIKRRVKTWTEELRKLLRSNPAEAQTIFESLAAAAAEYCDASSARCGGSARGRIASARSAP